MLAILTTHPIQYQTPIWQQLAADGRVPFEVWYLTGHGIEVSRDPEFGLSFSWDLDSLSGYTHRRLAVADGATPTTFWKCRLQESLRKRIRDAGVTAIWIQGWQVLAYWQAVHEAKAAGAAVWLRGESNDLKPVPWWKRNLKRALLGWLFRRIDRFLYIGTANKRLYESYGVHESALLAAPYAVDNERFARQAEALRGRRSEIRREWKIPADAFCILFCGKFIEKKRPHDVVASARLLSTDAPVHLLFVGAGELGASLRAQTHVVFDADAGGAAGADRGPQATFAGFLNQTEISRAYVAADCLVLPSDHGETWGLVVNEAIASGLPCVVSDACGCAEDVSRVAGCRRFELGDVEGLARELRAVRAASGVDSKTFTERFSFRTTIESVVQSFLGR